MYDIWAHAKENDSVLMAATVDRVMMVSVAGWGEGGPRFCLDTASSFPHRRLHGDPQPADNWELWQLRRTCTAFQKSKPDNCILPNRCSCQTVKTNIAVQLFWGQGGVFPTIYVVGNNICSVSAEFFTFPFCVWTSVLCFAKDISVRDVLRKRAGRDRKWFNKPQVGAKRREPATHQANMSSQVQVQVLI